MSFLRQALCFITLLVCTFGFNASAQSETKETPSRATFVESEPNVLQAIQWLEDTPLDQDTAKRKDVEAALIAWISESPTVSIEVYSEIVSFTKNNSILLIYYLTGWTKYALMNNYSEDIVACSAAGIRSAINVYKKGVMIKKDKEVEKLIALDKAGKLETWIKSSLPKNE